ncbi:MAG: class I SAM-dependent methyltransferase [Acidobacteriota bacterium]|jgi:2-polyprenyl-3-methyl-5-hydroxy-6-metoxy-1,4-benzoquinol methylase|nr:class I SAM-dependent methyltransferase [Acidobacteriota bacterium]
MAGITSNYTKHTQSKGLRKLLIERFDKKLLSLFAPFAGNVKTLIDVGCGEGFTLKKLHARHPHVQFAGCDINADALELAKAQNPDAHFFVANAYAVQAGETFDAVICSEVLEHLEQPGKALSEIKRLVDVAGGGCVILSVPDEPFFRLCNFASGKYLKTFGNHPEHIQNFSRRAFYDLCSRYFTPIACTTSFPWSIFVGKKE